MKIPDPSDLDRILEKINEIAKESATGDYIYRGEPAHHEEHPYYGRVTSGLYRQHLETGVEYFDIKVVQQQILTEAREYIPDEMSDFELLATLQHHGDKTNLIDFTTDYLVALFFACNGKPEESGRVILLQRQSAAYEVEKPPRTIRRADIQKSIFVQAPQGVVKTDEFKVICIPVNLKLALSRYLRKHHNISTKTIYNDLHGFIEQRRLHGKAYTEFYKGVTSQGRADSAKTEAGRQKCYNDAITHYTEAIDLNPELTEVYNNRGVANGKTGNFHAAIQDFNTTIDLNPEIAGVYNNRGNAYTLKMDFDAAIQDYNKAIDLNPEYATAYNNRGAAYGEKGEVDPAIQDYNKAIDLNPEYAEAYYNRGNAYNNKGEVDPAIQDYNKAIDLNPEYATAYNNRGNTYYKKGEVDPAIQDYNKAIDLNPEHAEAYYNRGIAYGDKGEVDPAIQDYNKAIDLNPEHAEAYYNRGIAYGDKGEVDPAIQDYNIAIELNSEDADFYYNRGVVYGKKGDFDAAIQDYNTAIELNPELADVYYNRGTAYYKKGEVDPAIQDFDKAIELNPEYAEAYYNRGGMWLYLKDWQKAKADLTAAKDMGIDIAALLHINNKSVEDFEAKNKVKVPEDIADLLRGE